MNMLHPSLASPVGDTKDNHPISRGGKVSLYKFPAHLNPGQGQMYCP